MGGQNLTARVRSAIGLRPKTSQPVNDLQGLQDLSAAELQIVREVRPFTMTSPERLAAAIGSVKYVVKHGIPGDIAECGVWRGGSTMAMALTLKLLGDTSRKLYLFDTFDGMSEPTERDRSIEGALAHELLAREDRETGGNWCFATYEDVRANIRRTGYPEENVVYVRGKVEDTIPGTIPSSMALLRLDTDWYASTKHELEHLYPRLNRHGVLIIDDYGHWEGARGAVDEYFSHSDAPVFLHRIDYTGRLVIKST